MRLNPDGWKPLDWVLLLAMAACFAVTAGGFVLLLQGGL